MIIKQLSVFLENDIGALFNLTKALCENNIDMLNLNIAETEEYGIARILVDEPEKACTLLKNSGFSVKLTDVLHIAEKNKPGTLHETLCRLKQNNINVEYLYVFAYGGIANIIIRVEDIIVANKLF